MNDEGTNEEYKRKMEKKICARASKTMIDSQQLWREKKMLTTLTAFHLDNEIKTEKIEL